MNGERGGKMGKVKKREETRRRVVVGRGGREVDKGGER